MVIRFTQLSLDEWPIGVAQEAAVVALSPAEIERRVGIAFERSHDDLDEYDGALIQLPDGTPVALQRHRHAPVSGTTIIIHEGAVDALVKALTLLTEGAVDTMVKAMAVLAEDDAEVTWIAPELVIAPRVRNRKRPPAYKAITKPFRRRGHGIHLRGSMGHARRRLAARHRARS